MTIFGIEGGIGTGKTLTGVALLLKDLEEGRKIITNTSLKNLGVLKKNVTFLTAEMLNNIFELVKTGELNLENTTIFIQEAHNYIDSRNSATKKNRIFSYFILQSRHTGAGSCDIIYDTQELGQVDVRLRRNTDFILHPYIVRWEEKRKGNKIIAIPKRILVSMLGKVGHKAEQFSFELDTLKAVKSYDTHEIVEF